MKSSLPTPAVYPCTLATCGKDVPDTRRRYHSKFCSRECNRESQRQTYRQANPAPVVPLSTGTTGAVAELLVAADLMKRGFEVFRALSQSTSCDLAILREGRLLRVEVKTGWKLPSGEVRSNAHRQADRHDIAAIYLSTDGSITYVPGLP